MTTESYERARSPRAKQDRETSIMDSARRLAVERGVRAVTLTDIAAGVGLHKSGLLRYFETREEIFLRLSAEGWLEWSLAVAGALDSLAGGALPAPSDDTITDIGRTVSASLASRPLFCDLLAHTPMNLERGVSLDSARRFKLTALGCSANVQRSLQRLLPLSDVQASNTVATATGLAGALWQMSASGTALRELYESDAALARAIVDVEPRLTDVLTALLRGYTTATSTSEETILAPDRQATID
ncbi:TetR family transcriptional regulator [Curtobacterium sp. MCBA15_008]|uniref:TetR family transcriptional regulator n=1 Tax=Curtobacterium sp. MCBA15_008 TaxID=1898736 RepID=UPI0008DDE1B9|nr:TetR family transcriptional regulator [Curtobacterium sp. MCBA15_008]OII06907.1 TetR family transcriptional regulator [Curtobacterium sp. MCBA15_008]